MNRLRAWLVVTPLVAAGMLVGHAVAYRVTGTPGGSLHSYLEHAPQLVLLVSILAVGLAGLGARLQAPPASALAALAPVAFLVQEHLERLVHAGQLSWVLTTPAVALGVVLQVPVAIVVWLLARWLLRTLAPLRVGRPRVARGIVALAVPVSQAVAPVPARALAARGPPWLLRP